MQLGSPIEAVSAAIYHAAHIAFPDIHYQDRDWAALEGLSLDARRKVQLDKSYPMVAKIRRPDVREIEVTAMFPQMWGSTALGFGGLGGAAMTQAYTVVVKGPGGELAVYWTGRHAYTLGLNAISVQQRADFEADLNKKWTVKISEAEARYGAVSSRKSMKKAKTDEQSGITPVKAYSAPLPSKKTAAKASARGSRP